MLMHPLRTDIAGVESLPMKLIIVAVVATMSVVPAAQALSGLENREFARRSEIQLELIVTAAQVLTVQGPGNARTLSIDFSTNGKLGFDRFTIGDRVGGPNSSSVILAFNNGAVMIRIADDPGCVICTSDMVGLTCTQCEFNLRMVAVLGNRTTLIVVELA